MKQSLKKNVFHYGITSRTNDGLHVLFLDYDIATPDRARFVVQDITALQENCGVGDAYVFLTKHGFHAVFLEKYRVMDAYDILQRASSDLGHKNVPLYGVSKRWVLRRSKKKSERYTYLGVIRTTAAVPPIERSRGHAQYLWRNAKVPEEDLRCRGGARFDDENTIEYATYRINKRDN